MVQDLNSMLTVADCIHPIVAGALGALLLGYPARIQQVHAAIQILICASLTTVGISAVVSFVLCSSDVCSACHQWVMYMTLVLSAVAVIAPAIGAIIGLGLASGLLAQAIYPNVYLVTLASLCGVASMFIYRDLLLHWQLFAPPVIGGYFAALAMEGQVSITVQYVIWVVAATLSLALHIRRRRVNTWLENKHDQALYSEESQIVQVMRHSQPTLSVEDFEKMKVRLLEVVQGDTEQADRIIYGGGLY